MIVFVCTIGHEYTIRRQLAFTDTALRGRICILFYKEFFCWNKLPAGSYIFSDLERLTPEARELVSQRIAGLREAMPGMQMLNDPAEVGCRHDLLARLYEAGINRFQSFRADEFSTQGPERLERPVFIRRLDDHEGPLTPLIETRSGVFRALSSLARGDKSIPEKKLLIIEAIDARNEQGHFERYTAFKIGDRIFSGNYDCSVDWINKGIDETYLDPAYVDREFELIRSNPHEDMLRPIFDLAQVDYGRMDYAFEKTDTERARPQVFEINTNPYVETPNQVEPVWRPAVSLVNKAYSEALLSWGGEGKAGHRMIRVPRLEGREAARICAQAKMASRSPRRIALDVMRGALARAGRITWEPALVAHAFRTFNL